MLIIGFLQIFLIKPYFRNQQVTSIEVVADELENGLLLKDVVTEEDVSAAFSLIFNNNMCAVVYNQDGVTVYESDALGATCIFDRMTTIGEETYVISQQPQKLINTLIEQGFGDMIVTSDLTGQEMLLYGREINGTLSNYYLFINAPTEPIDSYIQLFIDQFILIAIVVFVLAIFVSLLLANKITSPIVKIRKEATKLQKGNYDVDFAIDSYTEINDLAKTLNEASKQLEVTDELRKDLIANVSHDIKTPLTMIKAYSEMIRDISGSDPVKREEHLNVIIEETDYLNKLVDDMRDVSKLQAGQTTLKRENFDLMELIERIIDHYKGFLGSGKIDLEKDLVPCVIWADKTGISRVISNFLSNAIKYSFEDSTITIKMIDSEDAIRVEITDEGRGIAESELPYIWSRYYKIDKGFTRTTSSTGLGLAIAKAILEAHGANYGVTSKVNVGSTFYFELSKDYDEKSVSARDWYLAMARW